jgi:tetratricopeptide (TPR) repeat protein
MLLAVFLAYSIFGNPTIHALWPLGLINGPRNAPVELHQLVYIRPFANFTLAVNFALGALDPRGYHIVNLAIHAASTLLLFGILRRTFQAPLLAEKLAAHSLSLAALCSLLWALHPIQTEAVNYTHQRVETLMAMFYLLTLYCWIRGAEGGSKGWLVLAIASSFLGMSSKEAMATAPLMVFLYDGMFLARSYGEALRKRWLWYLGLLLSAGWLLFLMVNSALHSTANLSLPVGGSGGLSAAENITSYAATELGVILYYLRLLAWPDPLVFYYNWPAAATWPAVVLPGLVVLLGVFAAAWGLRWRRPWAYPIAWYLIILSPSSSVVPLWGQYIWDYRVYLPSIAPISAVVVAVYLVLRRVTLDGRLSVVVEGAILVALLFLVVSMGDATRHRNLVYRTARSLWQDTVLKVPDSALARSNFGSALVGEGRWDEAADEFRAAFPLDSNLADPHNNLGVYLNRQGKFVEAIEQFQIAVRIKPTYAIAYYNLGLAFYNLRRFQEAVTAFGNSLRLDSGSAEVHNNMGAALLQLGRLEQAAEQFREAIRLAPNIPVLRDNLTAVERQLRAPAHR